MHSLPLENDEILRWLMRPLAYDCKNPRALRIAESDPKALACCVDSGPVAGACKKVIPGNIQ